ARTWRRTTSRTWKYDAAAEAAKRAAPAEAGRAGGAWPASEAAARWTDARPVGVQARAAAAGTRRRTRESPRWRTHSSGTATASDRARAPLGAFGRRS